MCTNFEKTSSNAVDECISCTRVTFKSTCFAQFGTICTIKKLMAECYFWHPWQSATFSKLVD